MFVSFYAFCYGLFFLHAVSSADLSSPGGACVSEALLLSDRSHVLLWGCEVITCAVRVKGSSSYESDRSVYILHAAVVSLFTLSEWLSGRAVDGDAAALFSLQRTGKGTFLFVSLSLEISKWYFFKFTCIFLIESAFTHPSNSMSESLTLMCFYAASQEKAKSRPTFLDLYTVYVYTNFQHLFIYFFGQFFFFFYFNMKLFLS